MEIRNEVKQKDKEVEKKKFVVRNAADIQRAKLEKLMKNPDKPVIIPTTGKNRDFSTAIPSFVRNVMGSSAGAGSGEFHVYRHLRRKEYARQKQIQEKSHAEQLDDAFQQKLENNRKAAEERTAKKRAKRLKKKAKQKTQQRGNGKKPKLSESGNDLSGESSDESEGEEQDEEPGDKGDSKDASPMTVEGEDSRGATEKENEKDQTQNQNENASNAAGGENDSNDNENDEGGEKSTETSQSPAKNEPDGEPKDEKTPHGKDPEENELIKQSK